MLVSDVNGAPRYSGARLWMFRGLGAVFIVIGTVLAVGGYDLAILGGSRYCVIIGRFLIVAGAMAILGRIEGLYLYILAFLITLVWSLFEVGLDGWALVPRLVGPFTLLIMALLVMPSRCRTGNEHDGNTARISP